MFSPENKITENKECLINILKIASISHDDHLSVQNNADLKHLVKDILSEDNLELPTLLLNHNQVGFILNKINATSADKVLILSKFLASKKTQELHLSVDPLVKDANLKEKEGSLWECISSKPGPNGGIIYLYKLREKFDSGDLITDESLKKRKALKKKQEETFPAVEPDNKMLPLNPSHAHDLIPLLASLGYVWEEKILSLPDHKELVNGWIKLKAERPNLPPLKIGQFDYVLSPGEFIKNFTDYDAVLSSKEEFVHDSLIHVIPTLISMLENRDYTIIKNDLSKVLLYALEQIAKFKGEKYIKDAVEFNLGLSVDILSASIDDIHTINRLIEKKTPNDALIAIFYYLSQALPQIHESIVKIPKEILELATNATALWGKLTKQ